MKKVSGYYTRIVYYFYWMKIFHININLVKVWVIYLEMCGYNGRMSSNLSDFSDLEIREVRLAECIIIRSSSLTWVYLLTFLLLVHCPWRGLYPVHSEFNNWIFFHVSTDAAAVIGKLNLVQFCWILYFTSLLFPDGPGLNLSVQCSYLSRTIWWWPSPSSP